MAWAPLPGIYQRRVQGSSRYPDALGRINYRGWKTGHERENFTCRRQPVGNIVSVHRCAYLTRPCRCKPAHLSPLGVSTGPQAHTQACDAVLLALNVPGLGQSLSAVSENQPCLSLHSAATDSAVYLQRHDRGRRLDDASRAILAGLKAVGPRAGERPCDLAFAVVDGLSALAIAQNAQPFLSMLRRRIAIENWSVAPVCIVSQGRGATGEEVGELLAAKAIVVLIGERPGLNSPGSMGLCLIWMSRVGLWDDSRNCISNVRPASLGYEEAAYRAALPVVASRASGN